MYKLRVLSLGGLALGLALVWGGCATRGYVRKQVDQVRAEMAQSDTTMRADLQRTRSAADSAMSKAEDANRSADLAQRLALGDATLSEAGRYRVYFAFNSAKLDDAARSALDQVADQISHNPRYLVGLYGFADPRGSDAYNLDLGQRRAEAVQRYLVGRSALDLSRSEVISYGKNPPEAESGSLGTEPQHRQVLILLAQRVAPNGSTPQPLSEAAPQQGR